MIMSPSRTKLSLCLCRDVVRGSRDSERVGDVSLTFVTWGGRNSDRVLTLKHWIGDFLVR